MKKCKCIKESKWFLIDDSFDLYSKLKMDNGKWCEKCNKWSEHYMVEVVVYLTEDYSKNESIWVSNELTKEEITKIVNDMIYCNIFYFIYTLLCLTKCSCEERTINFSQSITSITFFHLIILFFIYYK